MDAVTHLKLAYQDIKFIRLGHSLNTWDMDGSLQSLAQPLSNVVKARELDPTASFADDDGKTQTCDSLAVELLENEIRLRYDYNSMCEQRNFDARRDYIKSGLSPKTEVPYSDDLIRENHEAMRDAYLKQREYAPYKHSAHTGLLSVYAKLGDKANAYDALQKALEIFPNDIDLLHLAQMAEITPESAAESRAARGRQSYTKEVVALVAVLFIAGFIYFSIPK